MRCGGVRQGGDPTRNAQNGQMISASAVIPELWAAASVDRIGVPHRQTACFGWDEGQAHSIRPATQKLSTNQSDTTTNPFGHRDKSATEEYPKRDTKIVEGRVAGLCQPTGAVEPWDPPPQQAEKTEEHHEQDRIGLDTHEQGPAGVVCGEAKREGFGRRCRREVKRGFQDSDPRVREGRSPAGRTPWEIQVKWN